MLSRIYSQALQSLAALAAALLIGVFVAIIYDVTIRTLGFQPPSWTTTMSEYAMLYATMLAAPWLVRRRGHVAVESLVLFLQAGARCWLERLVYMLCIAVALLLCFYSGELALQVYARGELDIRSVEAPRWLLFAVMPPSFFLVAVEFGRFLVGPESYFVDRTQPKEGL